MFDLTGKTALVTGASGAIGGAIARALHAQGATIAVSGTRKDALEAIAASLQRHRIDGVIATNTTIARTAIPNEPLAGQSGGLSGAPLMNKSTAVLRMLRTRLPEHIPLIGVGGILSGADAAKKMAAGATLVQLYSGLIYRGPKLIGECVEAMRRFMERYDLLLTPTVPITAFAAGVDTPDTTRFPQWFDWTPLTWPFNLTRQPAASVPSGFVEGLPIGLQIVGPMFAEPNILRASRCVEQACASGARPGCRA